VSNEAKPENLNDWFDDETVQATLLAHSANFARSRHSDFDETINGYVDKFTPEQHAAALSGKHDPAEYCYQVAREGTAFKETDLDDILEGRVKSEKPSLVDELDYQRDVAAMDWSDS
jgi:hypothetical protein